MDLRYVYSVITLMITVLLFLFVTLLTDLRFNSKECEILQIQNNYTNINIITILDIRSLHNNKYHQCQSVKIFYGDDMYLFHDKFLSKYQDFDRKYNCWIKKENPDIVYLNNPEKMFYRYFSNLMILFISCIFSILIFGCMEIDKNCKNKYQIIN